MPDTAEVSMDNGALVMAGRQMSAQSAQDDEEGNFVAMDPTGRYGRYSEVLGQGACKVVYKAFDEEEGIEVAWNEVKMHTVMHSSGERDAFAEVELLKSLQHKNIIKLYASWIDKATNNVIFITEIFTSGTLRQYRKKHKHVDMKAVKNWSRQILRGLLYLHSHNPPIIHRDLKCDNIFVNGNQGEVKIGDLGLAAILSHAHSAHSVIGTPEFMAPELYEEHYDEKVDIYAFGMCLLELITQEYPYSECSNPAQIFKKVTSGKKPAALAKVLDPEVLAFVEKCLCTEASKRLSAAELLQDPFLAVDSGKASVAKSDSFSSRLEAAPAQPPVLRLEIPTLADSQSELQHITDDSRGFGSRTNRDFRVKGKLHDDDTVNLRLRIRDTEGHVRTIQFPFNIKTDTALSVASEMVQELALSVSDLHTIALEIEKEVQELVPSWRPPGEALYEPPNGLTNGGEGSHLLARTSSSESLSASPTVADAQARERSAAMLRKIGALTSVQSFNVRVPGSSMEDQHLYGVGVVSTSIASDVTANPSPEEQEPSSPQSDDSTVSAPAAVPLSSEASPTMGMPHAEPDGKVGVKRNKIPRVASFTIMGNTEDTRLQLLERTSPTKRPPDQLGVSATTSATDLSQVGTPLLSMAAYAADEFEVVHPDMLAAVTVSHAASPASSASDSPSALPKMPIETTTDAVPDWLATASMLEPPDEQPLETEDEEEDEEERRGREELDRLNKLQLEEMKEMIRKHDLATQEMRMSLVRRREERLAQKTRRAVQLSMDPSAVSSDTFPHVAQMQRIAEERPSYKRSASYDFVFNPAGDLHQTQGLSRTMSNPSVSGADLSSMALEAVSQVEQPAKPPYLARSSSDSTADPGKPPRPTFAEVAASGKPIDADAHATGANVPAGKQIRASSRLNPEHVVTAARPALAVRIPDPAPVPPVQPPPMRAVQDAKSPVRTSRSSSPELGILQESHSKPPTRENSLRVDDSSSDHNSSAHTSSAPTPVANGDTNTTALPRDAVALQREARAWLDSLSHGGQQDQSTHEQMKRIRSEATAIQGAAEKLVKSSEHGDNVDKDVRLQSLKLQMMQMEAKALENLGSNKFAGISMSSKLGSSHSLASISSSKSLASSPN
eukprot:jgi/Chlat1/7055/Chrsp56S06721